MSKILVMFRFLTEISAGDIKLTKMCQKHNLILFSLKFEIRFRMKSGSAWANYPDDGVNLPTHSFEKIYIYSYSSFKRVRNISTLVQQYSISIIIVYNNLYHQPEKTKRMANLKSGQSYPGLRYNAHCPVIWWNNRWHTFLSVNG